MFSFNFIYRYSPVPLTYPWVPQDSTVHMQCHGKCLGSINIVYIVQSPQVGDLKWQ